MSAAIVAIATKRASKNAELFRCLTKLKRTHWTVTHDTKTENVYVHRGKEELACISWVDRTAAFEILMPGDVAHEMNSATGVDLFLHKECS